MYSLPQLIEEDMEELGAALGSLLSQSHATAAAIADKGGFLITHQGGGDDLDFTSVAALASGAFMATQSIASLIEGNEFDSVCQQGQQSSLFIQSVNDCCLLLVIHPPEVGVGLVKYFAAEATRGIARQLQVAHERDPSSGMDLSVFNLQDPSGLFKKRGG